MNLLWQDLRYALRVLTNAPGFTLATVLTLGIGIGACTLMFSAVNAILLRPLPFKDADRLVAIEGNFAVLRLKNIGALPREFVDYRDRADVFDHLAAFTSASASPDFNLVGSGDPERISGSAVSDQFFQLLGITPALGRTFLPDDYRANQAGVVMISDALWQRRFAGNPNAVGSSLTLDSRPYIVVGVMPRDFKPGYLDPGFGTSSAAATDVWIPLMFTAEQMQGQGGGGWGLRVIGRMKPGITFDQTKSELAAIGAGFVDRFPKTYRGPGGEDGGWSTTVFPLQEEIVGSVREPLLILFAAVGFLMLIACANIANLMLARGYGRRREMAIRLAVGAGRSRIVGQLLTESLIVAFAGMGLGMLVVWMGKRARIALGPSGIPRLTETGIDLRVFAFALALGLVASVIFGLAPAIEACRVDLLESMKQTSKGGGTRWGVRRVLIVSEVALALVLLIGAGLTLKSFWRLIQSSPGFDAKNLITMSIDLPASRYAEASASAQFFQTLLERLPAAPGIFSAAAFTWPASDPFSIQGRPFDPASASVAFHRVVSPGYFRTLGIAVVHGRDFSTGDSGGAPGVAIVNLALARSFFAGQDPIGANIQVGGPFGPWNSIVGVVGDAANSGLGQPAEPELYLASGQRPQSQMVLVARAGSDPLKVIPLIRSQVWAIDPDQPISQIATMQEILLRAADQPRFSLALLVSFAGIALILAIGGIYAMMFYSVNQRTAEIGIRMALGADRASILRMVLWQGIKLVVVGLAIGATASLALSRIMTSLLFQVSPSDRGVYLIAAAVVFALISMIACYLPARRATRVDPMAALRIE
jgi:putative ABC transport system permease protein